MSAATDTIGLSPASGRALADANQARGGLARPAIVALVMLSLFNMTNYFDRLIMSVVAQPVKVAFSLSDTELGLLSGPVFIAVYCSASVFFGWLADRYSRKLILTGAVALWSMMTFAGGLASSYGMLLVARAGVGFGEGASNPVAMSLFGDYFPTERRSSAAAIFSSVGMIGFLLSLLLGGWVAEQYGWRAAFFVAGIPGLLFGVIALFVVREPKRGAIDRQSAEALPFRASAKLLWNIKPYVWLMVALGLGVFGNLGMMQWLPVFFVRSHHLSLGQVGLFFGPALVVGLIAGQLLGGWIGDRLARRSMAHMLLIGIFANAAVVPLFWAALWVPSLPVALAFTIVAAAMSVIYSPAGYALLQGLVPTAVRGTAIGIFNIAGGVFGQAVLPLLVGVLSDALVPQFGTESLRVALTICLLTCFASSVAFVYVKRMMERDATSAPMGERP